MTFICCGKSKNSFDLLYCGICLLWLSETKSTASLRYVCIESLCLILGCSNIYIYWNHLIIFQQLSKCNEGHNLMTAPFYYIYFLNTDYQMWRYWNPFCIFKWCELFLKWVAFEVTKFKTDFIECNILHSELYKGHVLLVNEL